MIDNRRFRKRKISKILCVGKRVGGQDENKKRIVFDRVDCADLVC